MTTTPSYELYCGNSLNVLNDEVESESIDCIITSPDYWQLRGEAGSQLPGELSLEVYYTEYLQKLLAHTEEWYRVLKPGGTLFIVINDTYNTPKKGNTNSDPTSNSPDGKVKQKAGMKDVGAGGVNKVLQPGIMRSSVIGIPWRLAIAMIDSGKWCLRNSIIWYKRNGQPNIARSRFCIGDSEDIFFFTKAYPPFHYFNPEMKIVREVWDIPTQASKEEHYSQFPPALVERCIDAGCPPGGLVLDPFCGSGTTGVAALRMDRRFIDIDIVQKFVDNAKIRLDSSCCYYSATIGKGSSVERKEGTLGDFGFV